MSTEADQFNQMVGTMLGKWKDPKAPKARVRSVKIETVQFEGSWACDVIVNRVDGSQEVIPTKLYAAEQSAIGEAKRIRERLMREK